MKFYSIGAPISIVIFLLINLNATAQNSNDLWTKSSREEVSKSQLVDRKSEPTKALFYKLDLNALKSVLQNAPQRDAFNGVPNVSVNFPNAAGNLELYHIFEAPVMHPTLQAKYPDIRSYIGHGIENPSASIRFSVTPYGLHFMTMSSINGRQFIDPYSKFDNSYIVYSKQDLTATDNEFICSVIEGASFRNDNTVNPGASRNANDGMLRTYDLALGSSEEYSNFHGGTVPSVLAAMNVSMTRVNGIYENELSVTMQLVANNDLLISTTGNSIFGNTSSVINTSTGIIDGIIGSANYDIGHVFTTASGGVAGLGVVCDNGNKGRGTTGLSSPVGDIFDVDFVSHEMGHQFGANHTFNGNDGSCAGGNRNGSTAYEPGSGSTIMAYAGICASQNVQSNSDDYFHQISLNEIWALLSGTSCAVETATGNGAPTALAGNDYTIPITTPYRLTGSSSDPDGTGSHTFTWEQFDLGPSGVPLETNVSGPLVRSFEGTTDLVRYIPQLSDVISNGGVSTTWEKLASVSRDINFQLTVRDNDVNGGQTDSDTMIVTVDGSAGPFIITAPNTNVSWNIGSEQTVTWNVAQTTNSAVNCQTVNIKLSTDGGLTYPILLACNTPNDGTEAVVIPDNAGTANRIMVEASSNIFYDISDVDFSITSPGPNFVLQRASLCSVLTLCTDENIDIDLDFTTTSGFSESTSFSASNLPSGVIASFSPTSLSTNGTTTLNLSNFGSVPGGDYIITVTGTPAVSSSQSISIPIEVFQTSLSPTSLSSPSNGATGVVSPEVALSWVLDSNAEDYFVEVATDSGFSNVVESATVSTNGFTTTSLISNTQYFWRVTASNLCASAAPSSVFNFTTANIVCDFYTATDTPIAISSSPPPNQIYNSIISVGPDLAIADVNVTINITHTFTADLDIILTSPASTNVNLSLGNGGSGDNYTNTVFDQEAGVNISSGSAPFTGTFVPEGDLSTLNGELSGGDWTLVVFDTANGDGGTIDEFTLELCLQQTLSLDQSSIEQFSVFPNPNHGEFTVKLISNSGNNINISVYDIRGRKVFDTMYDNAVNFREVVRLNTLQSGIYMLKVSDGQASSTKKIIIE